MGYFSNGTEGMMSACEKCWADAYLRMRLRGGEKTQSECYRELLKEREDNPCSEAEQNGQKDEKEDNQCHDCFIQSSSYMKIFDSFISKIIKI